MSSLLRSSKFIRYCATAARSLVATNTRCAPETGHLHHPSAATNPLLRCLATQATAGFSSNLERSLQQLDQDVRRTGRISRKELEEVLEEIKQSKNATSSQSLLVIRCCGSLIPEELPEVRTQLVQKIWSTMEKLKVPMDISHYNALLRVYLENEHDFSPAEFLQELEKKGVEPNRVTYQRLITRYCQQGDIEGATRILEFMREKALPVNETVFNALIMGHSQADDMDSAVGILSVMKQAGLEPSADTYTTLLVGYAKRGDYEKIKEILAECDKGEIYLIDKDYLDVVYALATNGHAAFVDEILARTRKAAGFNQDAVSLILRLINKGQEDIALKVLRLMPRPQRDDNDGPSYQGAFLIRQLVKAQRPVESVLKICQTLEAEGYNNKALFIATETSFFQNNTEMSLKLLKALQETGAPIRQHYFWPLFCSAGRARDDNEIVKIIREMIDGFGLQPAGETVREYIVPNLSISDKDQIVSFLKQAGVSSGATASSLVFECLQANAITQAASVASKYRAFFPPELVRRPLNLAYLNNTSKIKPYLDLIHYFYEGINRQAAAEQDAEASEADKRNLVSSIIVDLLRSARGRPVELEPILQGLVDRGLGITAEGAEQIQARLSGEQLTNKVSELLATLTTQDLQATQAVRQRIPGSAFVQDEGTMRKRIEKLEQAGQSSAVVKRALLQHHCKLQEIDKALAVLKELEGEAGPGSLAVFIESLTAAGKLDDAFEQLKVLRTTYPEATLDPLKIVRLVEALFKQDRVEDGMRLLEEQVGVSRRYDDIPFALKASAFQALNILAEKGDVANVEKAFELLVKANLVEVSNVLLGPLVKVHVLKDDIKSALAKLEECVEKFKMTPWKSELTKKLIAAEDAVALQRVTDISSKVHGEVNSLYDLVFSFVECGRIRQARKILETPGLRNRQDRLNLICEKYQLEGSVAALEGLMEATKDMTHIDRSDIFNQLLNTHIKADNVDKALGVWTQMQEEDVQPSDAFLTSLANFLEKKGLTVPFVKPTVQVQKKQEPKKVAPEPKKDKTPANTAIISLRNALNAKDWTTAQKVKKELDDNKIALARSDLFNYIEGLCQSNNVAEASRLAIDALQKGTTMQTRIFRFLTNKLVAAGDVDSLSKIGELIDDNTKKIISFDNKLAGAYLNSGRAAEIMDKLQKEVEAATPADAARLDEKFPRGAISGIVETHPELLPKFEQMVEKYVELGCRHPANSLWMSLFLTPELASRADSAWQKYQLAELPRPMFKRILTRARDTLDYSLVQRLLATLKNSKVTEPAIGIVHACAIDVLVSKGDTEAALAHLKTSLGDVSLENIPSNSLRSLKEALEAKGKEFPYSIPKKQEKSSSSGSSDDEKDATASRK